MFCPACNVELVATCKSSLVLTVLEVVAEINKSKGIESITAEYWERRRLEAAKGTASAAEAARPLTAPRETVIEDRVPEGSLAGLLGVCFWGLAGPGGPGRLSKM